MRLNYDALKQTLQNSCGTSGTGGTTRSGAASGCPTSPGKTWDTVGHNTKTPELSHLSHQGKIEVGHGKPSVYAAVPRVPPVPPQNDTNEQNAELRRLVHEIAAHHGFTNEEEGEAMQKALDDFEAALESFRLLRREF